MLRGGEDRSSINQSTTLQHEASPLVSQANWQKQVFKLLWKVKRVGTEHHSKGKFSKEKSFCKMLVFAFLHLASNCHSSEIAFKKPILKTFFYSIYITILIDVLLCNATDIATVIRWGYRVHKNTIWGPSGTAHVKTILQ